MKKRIVFLALALLGVGGTCLISQLRAQTIDEVWIRKNYIKQEQMIPMRDGTKLYTAIYMPQTKKEESPFLMMRTPYGCAYKDKYESRMWGAWKNYAREHYIFVFQDVRGCGNSEGDFINIRPFLLNKKGKMQIDEASDFYDSANWLLNHVKGHNGKIGVIGSSYPGFYAMMAALSGHSALKVVVPEAPVVSWYRGDDWHHNGALFLRDAFSFHNHNSRPRLSIGHSAEAPKFFSTDEYSFYLKMGALKNLTRLFKGEVPFWNDMMNHQEEDAWWKARDMRQYCKDIKPAVMVVGGLFDAEDYYGACQLYRTLKEQSPKTDIHFAVGPWKHGGWQGNDDGHLGHIRFSSQNTTDYYKNEVEFPFVQHYLKDASVPLTDHKVDMFFTGENEWHKYNTWPLEQTKPYTLYLCANGKVENTAPTESISATSYVSDPAHPVPYLQEMSVSRPAAYITDDQRFAATRPDVLTFTGEDLSKAVTLCGDIQVDLYVSLSTTDADFVVKVLDVFPDDFAYNVDKVGKGDEYLMNGYELPVRMDIMRGRYRDGFAQGKAFIPEKITHVHFTMQSIAHTFAAGHKIAVQIQSSWFPLVDRNPQKFVNIATCNDSDYVKTTVQIFHQQGAASKITFGQLK